MDAPLVESSASPVVKRGTQVGALLLGLFVSAVIVVALIEGVSPGPAAFVIIAISLTLLLISIGILGNWLLKDKLETDRVKYVVLLQAVALVMLSASVLVVAVEPGCTQDTEYVVGGTSFGVAGSGLVLNLNNDPKQNVYPTGTMCAGFKFPQSLKKGSPYSVTLASQPTDSICSISGPTSGSKLMGDNMLIIVRCQVSVGGRVQNLRNDGLVLQNIASSLSQPDAVGVGGGNQTFQFPNLIDIGSTYTVTVYQQPTGQVCTVADGSGTAFQNIISITVSCQ
jgi:hypothetical protein